MGRFEAPSLTTAFCCNLYLTGLECVKSYSSTLCVNPPLAKLNSKFNKKLIGIKSQNSLTKRLCNQPIPTCRVIDIDA